MSDNYIFRINDNNPGLPRNTPVNRIIYSSFHRFETEIVSRGLSLKVPLEGEEKYILHNEVYKVMPGEYILTQDGQTVGYDLKKKTAIKGLCIYLEENLVNKAFFSCSSTHLHQLDHPFETEIPTISTLQGKYIFEPNRLSQLVNLIKSDTISNFETASLNELFYDVALELSSQWFSDQARISNLEMAKKSTREEIYLRLQKVRQFIHEEWQRPVSIKEMAEAGSFSQFHFMRCFKACYGYSPYQYLLNIRIEHAKELLAYKKYTVGEVALKAGFNDIFVFSKAFRKATGLPPSCL